MRASRSAASGLPGRAPSGSASGLGSAAALWDWAPRRRAREVPSEPASASGSATWHPSASASRSQPSAARNAYSPPLSTRYCAFPELHFRLDQISSEVMLSNVIEQYIEDCIL